MPTYHQIQQRLQADDDLAAFLTRKELKELPRIMFKDEDIETIFYGHYRGCNGILIASNAARLIFADKGVHALTTEVVDLEKVTATETEFKGKFGRVAFQLPKKSVVFEYLDQKTYDALTAWLKTKQSDPSSRAQISHEVLTEEDEKALSAPPANDLVAKLERLARLKDQGILTDAEFRQQKQRLLDEDDSF